jgi:hypothetical protein
MIAAVAAASAFNNQVDADYDCAAIGGCQQYAIHLPNGNRLTMQYMPARNTTDYARRHHPGAAASNNDMLLLRVPRYSPITIDHAFQAKAEPVVKEVFKTITPNTSLDELWKLVTMALFRNLRTVHPFYIPTQCLIGMPSGQGLYDAIEFAKRKQDNGQLKALIRDEATGNTCIFAPGTVF